MAGHRAGGEFIEALELRRMLAVDRVFRGGAVQPEAFFPFGDKMVFAGYVPAGNQALWISDGTVAGTRVLQDDGRGAASPGALIQSGKYLYLSGDSGLVKTDGGASTIPITVDPPKYPYVTSGGFSRVAIAGDHIFFGSFGIGSHGIDSYEGALYYGSLADTHLTLVRATYDDGKKTDSWAPVELAAAGAKAYFTIKTSSGPQLWQSDGTNAGTAAIKFHATNISQLTSYGGEIYFEAETSAGNGLWKLKQGVKPVLLKACDSLLIPKQNPSSSAF
jgi:ELWxxDGT repeat protein